MMKQKIWKQFLGFLFCVAIAIVLYPVQASARVEISEVEVYCNPPVGGREAEFEAWTLTEGAMVYKGGNEIKDVYQSVAWYDETAGRYLKEGDSWITGHEYTIWVYLFIKNNNYTFATTTGTVSSSTIPNVYTTINGNSAGIRFNGSYAPNRAYVATYTFPACKAAPADITQVGVTNLSYPFAGQLVGYDVNLSGKGYKFYMGTEGNYTDGLLWYDATANQYVKKDF